MNHPFFSNKRLLLFYIIVWILVSSIHAVILNFLYSVPINLAIADSLVFNLIFALFGLSLWYIVAHSRYNKSPIINALATHLSSSALILLIWISLCDFIISAFSGLNVYFDRFVAMALPWRIISGLFYYSLLVLIYFTIKYYNDLQEKAIHEARLNEIIRTTELDLLKSQINPHFLFNSLNSISSLTITNPALAQEMIIKLSDFLRYTISQGSGSLVSLKEEINNVKRYLEIEQIRFGQKLQHNFTLNEACMNMQIPAMILQPLYENSVKHGVYESTETVIIETSCIHENNLLKITIVNNFDPQAISRKGTGMGIRNIDERLKLMYHQDFLLTTSKTENQFKVEILIPQNMKYGN